MTESAWYVNSSYPAPLIHIYDEQPTFHAKYEDAPAGI